MSDALPFVVEHLDPRGLLPHPENWRVHPEAQREALSAALDEFGWLAAPIFNRRTGHIVDGHLRVEEALRQALESIPVRVIDVDEPTERRVLASFDRIGELRDRDDDALADLLRSFSGQEEGLPPGWSDDDLSDLLAGLEGDLLPEIVEDEPTAAGPSRCSVGEVWKLGRHRLAIGDATESDIVSRLLGDMRIRCVWTDPPYGVSYAAKNEFLNEADRGNRNQTPIENDALPPEEVEALARRALLLASGHAEPGATCYVACPAGNLLPYFIRAIHSSGFTFRHGLVWIKNHFVLGRCDYHYRHEMVLYGWREGAHYFGGDPGSDTVFAVDRPHRSEEHPTMKPVALVAQMVGNSTRHGEVVYDPFGGSGTTLIACEQLGRICCTMELAPIYGDLVLARWEQLTGESAERLP